MVALLWALLAFACLYQFGTVHLTRRFLECDVGAVPGSPRTDPVCHLKTVHGAVPARLPVLASHCQQTYSGPVDLLFCAAAPDDPGLDTARVLALNFPGTRVLSEPPARRYANPKITALQAASELCWQPFLVSSDCDMRASTDFLTRMLAGFEDPQVGMVTCLYCVRTVSSAPVALEALSVVDFATSVLVARAKEGLRFGLGAGMAFRREALQSIGGFGAVGDFLADDYQLGFQLHRAGWTIRLAGTVLEDVLPRTTFREVLARQGRILRTNRVCRPAGHFLYIVSQGLVPLLGLLMLQPRAPSTWLAWAGWIALRIGCIRRCWTLLGGEGVAPWTCLVVLKDAVFLTLWLASFAGHTVEWAGDRYVIRPDGRMDPAPDAGKPSPGPS